MSNKFDVKGYETIVSQSEIQKWTFFSDVPREVTSAKQAGMKGYVVRRPGNKPLESSEIAEHKILEHGLGKILELL